MMKKNIFSLVSILFAVLLSGCAASTAAQEEQGQKLQQTTTGTEVKLPQVKKGMSTTTPAASIAAKMISPVTH